MAYYFRATSGLGQEPTCTTVPYVTSTGGSGVGNLCADDSGKCGDAFALQQALNYLGYGPLDVDGNPGGKTLEAVKNYANAKGVKYPGSYPGYEVCSPLVAEYAGESAPPAAAPTTSLPKAINVAGMRMPRLSKTIAAGVPRTGTPGAPTPGAAPPADIAPVSAPGFWAGLPDWQKYAIIGGGVAVVGGVAYLLMSRKPRVAVANRRGRRSPKDKAFIVQYRNRGGSWTKVSVRQKPATKKMALWGANWLREYVAEGPQPGYRFDRRFNKGTTFRVVNAHTRAIVSSK